MNQNTLWLFIKCEFKEGLNKSFLDFSDHANRKV